MNNILFYNEFVFSEFRFTSSHVFDCRNGNLRHHLGFLKSGSAVFKYENGELNIREGDFFYIPAGLKYRSVWYGDEIVFDSYAFETVPEKHNISYKLQKIEMNDSIREKLCILSQNKTVSLKSVGLLYMILGEAFNFLEAEKEHATNEIIERAYEFMYSHNDYKIGDIAKYCHISESGLYNAFKKVTGNTPNEKRLSIKIKKATELLSTTDMTIENISSDLGFSSTSYFRKVFKAHTGKTPREVRNLSVF